MRFGGSNSPTGDVMACVLFAPALAYDFGSSCGRRPRRFGQALAAIRRVSGRKSIVWPICPFWVNSQNGASPGRGEMPVREGQSAKQRKSKGKGVGKGRGNVLGRIESGPILYFKVPHFEARTAPLQILSRTGLVEPPGRVERSFLQPDRGRANRAMAHGSMRILARSSIAENGKTWLA